MKVYVFNKNGEVQKVINMGTYESGKEFLYRMSKGYYHMPISTSNWCVYHEVYSGPFKKEKDVKYPKWRRMRMIQLRLKNFLKE